MNKPEKKLWDKIKKYMPGDTERVENICSTGMPDISGAWKKDYWIELKYYSTLKNKSVQDLLRPSQLGWHRLRAKYGSIIFVIVEKNFVGRCHEYYLYEYDYSSDNYILILLTVDKFDQYTGNTFRHQIKGVIER